MTITMVIFCVVSITTTFVVEEVLLLQLLLLLWFHLVTIHCLVGAPGFRVWAFAA